MPDFTALFKKHICCWVTGAGGSKRLITVSWSISIILVVIAFIIACAAAADMKTTGGDQIAAFTAMWTVLLLIVISIVGSAILRRNHTPLAIGALLGIMFIVCQQMLIIFAIFVERSQFATNPGSIAAQQAMAVFSFFIFMVYGTFGTLLAVFRDDIIKADTHTNLGEVSGEDARGMDKNAEYEAQNSI